MSRIAEQEMVRTRAVGAVLDVLARFVGPSSGFARTRDDEKLQPEPKEYRPW